jgi:hypothetical protein
MIGVAVGAVLIVSGYCALRPPRRLWHLLYAFAILFGLSYFGLTYIVAANLDWCGFNAVP